MIKSEALRHLSSGPRADMPIATAATILGWSSESLTSELSAAYLVSAEEWRRRPVPWHVVAMQALQETSYEIIERELGDRATMLLPDLVRLTSFALRLPKYQVAAIRSAAKREGRTVNAFAAQHFMELASLEASYLNATVPGYAEALHWPSLRYKSESLGTSSRDTAAREGRRLTSV